MWIFECNFLVLAFFPILVNSLPTPTCFYTTALGLIKPLPVGQTIVEGIFQHSCEAVPGEPGAVKYSGKIISCTFDGKTYQKSETWTSGRIVYECLDEGAYKSVGCQPKPEIRLNVGDIAIEGDPNIGTATVHRCLQSGDSVLWRSDICGLVGTLKIVCPEPKSSEPGSQGTGTGEGEALGGAGFLGGTATCSSNGRAFSPGETWMVGHLWYRCQENGLGKTFACTPDGQTTIDPGSSILTGDPETSAMIHHCSYNGDVVVYRSQNCGKNSGVDCPCGVNYGVACPVKIPENVDVVVPTATGGKPCYMGATGHVSNGITWVQDNRWKRMCDDGEVKTVACIFTVDGVDYEVGIGKTRDVRIWQHMCDKDIDDPSIVRYSTKVIACEVDGTIYKKGQTWTLGKIYYECKDDGAFVAAGCEPELGLRIAPGETKLTGDNISGRIHTCTRNGNIMSYRGKDCGVDVGIVCES